LDTPSYVLLQFLMPH